MKGSTITHAIPTFEHSAGGDTQPNNDQSNKIYITVRTLVITIHYHTITTRKSSHINTSIMERGPGIGSNDVTVFRIPAISLQG